MPADAVKVLGHPIEIALLAIALEYPFRLFCLVPA
jgi:hypothetical protein